MENNNSNKFLSGFVWGVLIGAGAIIFLKSEKGKELLSKLSEEGLEQLSDIVSKEEEKIKANNSSKKESTKSEENNTKSSIDLEDQDTIKILHVHSGAVDTEVSGVEKQSEKHAEQKKPHRKFFKGLSKK